MYKAAVIIHFYIMTERLVRCSKGHCALWNSRGLSLKGKDGIAPFYFVLMNSCYLQFRKK